MKTVLAALSLACALLAVATAGAATRQGDHNGGHKKAHAAKAAKKAHAKKHAAAPKRAGKIISVKAAGAINWGVADDASKYADDGGSSFYGLMQGAGLSSNRWTLAWNSSNPTAITELPFLQRAAPKAQAAGVHVVLALYAGQNGTSTPDAQNHDATSFCTWAGIVAQTVKQWGIRDFIIGNEPNSTLYWAPQKDASGNDVAAPAYEQLLAQCYDVLHGLDGGGWTANVIGMGLAAKAANANTSNQPLAFLRDVGAAYKASGRQTPIMDQLALHPYPLPASVPSPDKGYTNTPDAYGPPDLDRVAQAVYDAFNGTAQPTTLNGLTFRLDEFGWQTQETGDPYTGTENAGPPGSAPAVSQGDQTTYLQQAAQMFACNAAVSDVELFLLVDEKNLAGWQSGLIRADGAKKQAYSALASTFAAGRGACTSGVTTWAPSGSTGGSAGNDTSGGGTSRHAGQHKVCNKLKNGKQKCHWVKNKSSKGKGGKKKP